MVNIYHLFSWFLFCPQTIFSQFPQMSHFFSICDFLSYPGVFGFWRRKSNVSKIEFYLLGTSLRAFYCYLNGTYLSSILVRLFCCPWALFSQFFQMAYFFFNCDFLFSVGVFGFWWRKKMCLKLIFTYWAQVSEHFIAILMVNIQQYT